MEEGICNDTWFDDEHFSKALSPIEVIKEGIVISVNNEHPLNVISSIKVTEEGNVICANNEQ